MTRAWPELIDDATELRHRLHSRPELTWSEHLTASEIRDRLDVAGISWRACARTGTVATLAPDRAGPSRRPPRRHGCHAGRRSHRRVVLVGAPGRHARLRPRRSPGHADGRHVVVAAPRSRSAWAGLAPVPTRGGRRPRREADDRRRCARRGGRDLRLAQLARDPVRSAPCAPTAQSCRPTAPSRSRSSAPAVTPASPRRAATRCSPRRPSPSPSSRSSPDGCRHNTPRSSQ